MGNEPNAGESGITLLSKTRSENSDLVVQSRHWKSPSMIREQRSSEKSFIFTSQD